MATLQQALNEQGSKMEEHKRYSNWWNSLTSKEAFGIHYLLLYNRLKRAKLKNSILHLRHSQIRRLIYAPPLLEDKSTLERNNYISKNLEEFLMEGNW